MKLLQYLDLTERFGAKKLNLALRLLSIFDYQWFNHTVQYSVLFYMIYHMIYSVLRFSWWRLHYNHIHICSCRQTQLEIRNMSTIFQSKILCINIFALIYCAFKANISRFEMFSHSFDSILNVGLFNNLKLIPFYAILKSLYDIRSISYTVYIWYTFGHIYSTIFGSFIW